jgi:hypothetical protein
MKAFRLIESEEKPWAREGDTTRDVLWSISIKLIQIY